jgi:hypothetical protein
MVVLVALVAYVLVAGTVALVFGRTVAVADQHQTRECSERDHIGV